MKIVAVSDLHGNLIDLPDSDVIIVAGDFMPNWNHTLLFQKNWLEDTFNNWVEMLNRPCIVIAGNHDLLFEFGRHLVPSYKPYIYLEDSGVEIGGLNFYGTPHQPIFGVGWAFNLDEPTLAKKWAKIPDGTDVLITHGPPHGYFDWSVYDKKNVGSPSLTERVLELPQLKLNVFGHIHDSYGSHTVRGKSGNFIQIANVSICNEQYQPVNKPMVFEL